MQVKYKVNTHGKATLSNRAIKKVAAELDRRKSVRRLIRFIVILLIVVFIIYLIVSGNDEGKRLAENYDKLKARIDDSKHSFDRRIKLFEKNANGEIILTDTATSVLNGEQQRGTEEESTTHSSSVKFEFTSGIDWSKVAVHNEMAMQRAYESTYQLLKKYNASDEFIAGVLGNAAHEAQIGQWEWGGHAATKHAEYAKTFDANPGNGVYEEGYVGVYADHYTHRVIGVDLDLCWNEFYEMCSRIAIGQGPNLDIGFHNNVYPGCGAIGKTGGVYYEGFCKWMEENNKTLDTGLIDQDTLTLCDVYASEYYLGERIPGYLEKFNNGYTKGGKTNKVEQACALWFYDVEQPGDDSLPTRCEYARDIYNVITGAK